MLLLVMLFAIKLLAQVNILMNNILKEEFGKQQKNLLNLISGNFDITMTEIKKVKSKFRAYRDNGGRKIC